MEALTYRFTQLYYNYAGYVRVPACCLYAHRLAYFHGDILDKEVEDDTLRSVLSYL